MRAKKLTREELEAELARARDEAFSLNLVMAKGLKPTASFTVDEGSRSHANTLVELYAPQRASGGIVLVWFEGKRARTMTAMNAQAFDAFVRSVGCPYLDSVLHQVHRAQTEALREASPA